MSDQAKKLYLSENINIPTDRERGGVIFGGCCFWEAIVKAAPKANNYEEAIICTKRGVSEDNQS